MQAWALTRRGSHRRVARLTRWLRNHLFADVLEGLVTCLRTSAEFQLTPQTGDSRSYKSRCAKGQSFLTLPSPLLFQTSTLTILLKSPRRLSKSVWNIDVGGESEWGFCETQPCFWKTSSQCDALLSKTGTVMFGARISGD